MFFGVCSSVPCRRVSRSVLGPENQGEAARSMHIFFSMVLSVPQAEKCNLTGHAATVKLDDTLVRGTLLV